MICKRIHLKQVILGGNGCGSRSESGHDRRVRLKLAILGGSGS